MAFNLLEHVALAYQPIWGPGRQLVGVRLRVHALDAHSVDAVHLLRVLNNEWTAESPFLLLSFADAPQLLQALQVAPSNGHWLEIPDFGPHPSPELLHALASAQAKGHRLVQAAPLARAQLLPASIGPGALRHLFDLPPELTPQTLNLATPVLAGQLCQHVTTRELADRCLDVGRAWGLCGWPNADVLRHQQHGLTVDKPTLVRVQQALLHDQPIDVVEDLIHQDVVLTYRLLRLVNSAVFGLNRQVETTRQAILLLGQKKLRDWLLDQLPGATADPDLQPVRQAMVLRARLMEYLMDAGVQSELRSEIYVTGLFSYLQEVTHEPLAAALQRLPVSEAMTDALLGGTGPYGVYLTMARCMEYGGGMATLADACLEAEFPLDQANRALIRMLAHWRNAL
jgi:c-di-GMP phosphodiesterase